MGKGDKKSKRGKIWLGSYGVSRKRKKKRAVVAAAESPAQLVEAEEPATKPRRTARKKTTEA